jgi:L-gulono-1,4-lactone dehydrogenase
MPAATRITWRNYVDDQTANPLKFFKPGCLEDLRQILVEARSGGYKVKAVGSGHSSSDIALSPDYMIDTHGLDRVLDTGLLDLDPKAPPEEDLFFIECGITIRTVNKLLEKRKKALVNMGAYDGQTIAGVISTSTHGSGASLGAFPDYLEAILLLGEDGTLYHIERSRGRGISKGPAQLPSGLRFIQDDAHFFSAGVSMGCMGIIYAVVIRVTDRYMLKETRFFTTWTDIKTALRAGKILSENRHLEVLVSPYRRGGKDHKCLVTKRNKTEAVYKSPLIPRGHRKILPELFVLIVPDVLIDAVMRFLINHFPTIIPFLVQSELNTLTDRDYIDKSYKVLDLGPYNNLSAYAAEIALPASRYLEAVEEIIRVVNQSVAEGKQYLNAPFSLRFVRTNEFFLSMQYGHPGEPFVCMIEFPTAGKTIGGMELLGRIETALYAYGGIPHWGQVNHVGGTGRSSLGRLYPRFHEWVKVLRALSPEGRFDNDFTRRCGISVS